MARRLRPRRVYLPYRVVSLSCGHEHTAVSCIEGGVYWWGGAGGGAPAPVRVKGDLEGEHVTSVVCGHSHTFAIVEGGRGGAFSWGSNQHGEMGCGAATGHEMPVRVIETSPTRRLRSVSGGCCAEHTVFDFASQVTTMYHFLFPLARKSLLLSPLSPLSPVTLFLSCFLSTHARFPRFNQLSREAAMAVLMGTHARLGEGSPLQQLDGCIVATIARM